MKQEYEARFFLIGLIIICKFLTANSTDHCTAPTTLYESLKCIPIFEYPVRKCPWKYDCSHIEERAFQNEQKCYFEDNVYQNGKDVKNNADILGNCKADCQCRLNEFQCADIDCEEHLTIPKLRPGCYLKYELNNCCSIGEVCHSSKHTCLVDGKKLLPGMKFDHPEIKCAQCVCQEILNGRIARPVCKKQKCIEEITNQKMVYNFCAPVFTSIHRDCCPFTWICPAGNNQMSNAFKPTSDKCRYGTELLKIGHSFSENNAYGYVSCECRIPPYITCVQVFNNTIT